ncbi:MAG: hypothetical protein JNM21_08030 [Taibaiella sp.]|nr:hypothetical protein [Taibaiella sp.]
MRGYVLRVKKEEKYLGLDKSEQDWMDYLPKWNILNPQFKIEIDEYIYCHYSGEFKNLLKYYNWINIISKNHYSILYFDTNLLDNISISGDLGFAFIGYDVVCLKESKYLEEYFYSSLFNEVSIIDDLLEQENSKLKFCNELNNYGLFVNLSVAEIFLQTRNEYYNQDRNSLFETAYGISYEIVKVYLWGGNGGNG